jgi:hypothetical protein
MFSRILSNLKHYYAVPAFFMAPIKGFTGGYEEFIKYNNVDDVTLTHHTFCCIIGTWTGVISGAFLGAVWPISLPIFIGRCIDNKKYK